MSLLFDTHVLIWTLGFPDKLPPRIAAIIDDRTLDRCFSVLSIWEIVVKTARGRAEFRMDGEAVRKEFLNDGFREIAITSDHAFVLRDLPLLHRDPFDRMLVAQALSEGLTLVTADATLARYPLSVMRF